MFTSLQQLLTSIVDYAGLFPPTQLGLPAAMSSYDRARSARNNWMLDRFVLPASRLSEFMTLLPTFITINQSTNSPNPWSLSVILSKNWEIELEQIQAIATAHHSIEITALEIAPLAPLELEQVCDRLPAPIPAFFEIPFEVELDPYLAVLQQAGVAAKLRTGGVTSTAFPASSQLSQRILALAEAHIPFKATAGLHHPLRGTHHLTHQPDSPTAPMHGFLNMAILAAFAYHQSISLDDAVAILEAVSPDPFQFTETALSWGDLTLTWREIQQSRQKFFRSFGSCSWQTPIDDLQHLKLL
jgi:hypothetical protein